MDSKRLIRIWLVGTIIIVAGCGSREVKPIDIFPEDNCSHCKMTVSQTLPFASEIITEDNEIYKFDDIGCMEYFKQKSPSLSIAAIFVKDYESKQWLRYENATIVTTNIMTPMGSGKAAFSNSSKAREFAQKYTR